MTNTSPMDSAHLVGFLGAPTESAEVQQLLGALNTAARPTLEEDEPDQHYDWVLIRKKGIELGFADAAYFAGKPRDHWRSEGLILNQITFYSNSREGVSAYTDELPHGLLMTDSRMSARSKLAAFEATRHSYLTDRWDTEKYRLIIAYREDGSGLDSVHVKLTAQPLDERMREQPIVGASEWEQLFGLPAQSEQLRSALEPLDITARIEEQEDAREVDFLAECGLIMYFEKASQLKTRLVSNHAKGLVFGAVKFHRARDLEARGYTGLLPFGLDFEDSPDALELKLGRAPDRRIDGRLTGHALWHLDGCSLHVLYSVVENHLFRVLLMAPGYWQELQDPD